MKKILIILYSAVLFIGCSGDDNSAPPAQQHLRLALFSRGSLELPYTYNGSNFLTSLKSDSNTQDVQYDSQKRVIRNGWLTYTYNSSGRIATMQTENSLGTFSDAVFVYNNRGLVAQSSFSYSYIPNTDYYELNYEYDSNDRLTSIVQRRTQASGGNTYVGYSRYLYTYDSAGNIIQIKRQNGGSQGISYTDSETYTYTYDNKKNPIHLLLDRMGVESNLSLIYMSMTETQPFGNGNFDLRYYNPNNILTSSISFSGGSQSTTYDYVYNEEGYPISAESVVTHSDYGTDIYYFGWIYENYTE